MPLFAGTHILIIEDQALIAMDIEQVALDCRASSVDACRSDQAMDRLANVPDDLLIILDYHPNRPLTGALLNHIRIRGLRHIIITTVSPEHDPVLGVHTQVVTKPFSMEELRDAFHQIKDHLHLPRSSDCGVDATP